MARGKDSVPRTFSTLYRIPAKKGIESNSQQVPLHILVLRMVLLFVVVTLTFIIFCALHAKYFLFKRLLLELCTVFNIKWILESGCHKNENAKLFKYILHIFNQADFTNELFRFIMIHLPEIKECILSVVQYLGIIVCFCNKICIYLYVYRFQHWKWQHWCWWKSKDLYGVRRSSLPVGMIR